MVKFKHSAFAAGVHEIEFREKPESFYSPDYPLISLDVLCVIDKSSTQIVLKVQLDFALDMECDRCTSKYQENHKTEFRLVYLFNSEDVTGNDPNLRYLPPEQDVIVLDEDITEYIRLTIPMKHLCSEDCKGLCPRCGADLNKSDCKCKEEEINPVWEDLLKIKDKLNNQN